MDTDDLELVELSLFGAGAFVEAAEHLCLWLSVFPGDVVMGVFETLFLFTARINSAASLSSSMSFVESSVTPVKLQLKPHGGAIFFKEPFELPLRYPEEVDDEFDDVVLKPNVLLALSNNRVVTLTEVVLLRGEFELYGLIPLKLLDVDFFKLILLEFL